MKKPLFKTLTIFLSALSLTAFAQSFSDDFESYNVGDYIAASSPDWTTWSGNTGGNEDVQIVDDKANSGTKSIYMQGAPNGGPQDIVLPFGSLNETGTTECSMHMYIPANAGAYFNLQGNTTIGQIWAVSCFLDPDGKVRVSPVTPAEPVLGSFPHDQWFEVDVSINHNTNLWEISIDGIVIYTFQNETNQAASLNLFPIDGTHRFWIDDVTYNLTPFTPPTLNASAYTINVTNGLAGQEKEASVSVKNIGTTAISSFDVELVYNGNSLSESVSGLNLAPNATHDVNLNGTLTLISGKNNATFTISNVNGGTDDYAPDDVKDYPLEPVIPADGKVVLGEEATGTWCSWCPRGAVFMDRMEDDYHGFWAGVAVHNGDPMVVTEYDDGIGPLIGGYPSGLVDRGIEADPSEFPGLFIERITQVPSATITNGAFRDAEEGNLAVSLTVDFSTAVSGDWRLVCVLTEDSVTGTDPGYNQANSYAGGGNGPMGGYENLPSPVPAAQMHYNHTARAISPSFDGLTNTFPSSISNGETHTRLFNFPLNANWDLSNMHIVGFLIDDQGNVDNASISTIAEAEGNGLADGDWITGLEIPNQPDAAFQIFPNPAQGLMSVKTSTQGNYVLMDVTGKVVEQSSIPTSGWILLNGDKLGTGMYFLTILNQDAEKVHTEKVIFY